MNNEDRPKHIRIPLNFLNIENIKKLSLYPDGNNLTFVYFKLLLLVGDLNYDGKIPKSVLNKSDFPVSAVKTFIKAGLLEKSNPADDYYSISNWDIYKSYKPGKKTEWTRERVEEILKKNDYNMSKAARTLGNTKQFISLLAKKFGIKKPKKNKNP